MARGTPHPESTRVEAVRRALVLGHSKPQVAEDLGVSRSQVYQWCETPEYEEKARALGVAPSERRLAIDQQGEPEGPAPYAIEPTDADPLNPGPVTLGILAAAYALTDHLETLDDLVGWPRGTSALWFADAEGEDDISRLESIRADERQSFDLVRRLRRARAVADLDLIAMVASGKSGWRAASMLLEKRRREEFGDAAGASDDEVDPMGHLDAEDLAGLSGEPAP